MPLVAHNDLPAFDRLKRFGLEIVSLDAAVHQDIRELHIGLLNMMPDAALAATDLQFINLVGNCNKIAQFYVYPFSIPELDRGPEARAHIAEHYFDFSELRQQGLDALIITGANVANPSLDQEPFWEPLMDVVRWAEENVTSILCSCLATHAVVKHHHGIDRRLRPEGKLWGVYPHRVTWPDHPLVRDINTRFDAPHSRFNDVSHEQLEAAGLVVLAESDEAGVHLAVSPDLFRIVYFQGHPEYDAHSLLKEYKREVLRFLSGELRKPPPFPEHYFSAEARQLASAFLERAVGLRDAPAPDAFPDEELTALVDNTWRDTGKAIINNWLGLIYRLTSLDRRMPFMEGVDPDDPLGMRRAERM